MSRKYRNTAQWLELIEVFELSGQSQVEFCVSALKSASFKPTYTASH